MKFKRLGKRGDVRTLSPTELVGYVLGGIIILIIIVVAGIFTALYFSEKNEEFAINNFIALANKIETLSKSEKTFDVQRAFPFYIPSNFIIVGFNENWKDTTKSDRCEEEAVRKPSKLDGKEGEKCDNFACICLFGNSNDKFMSGNSYNVKLMQCHRLPGVNNFTTFHMEDKIYDYPDDITYNMGGNSMNVGDYSSINFKNYAYFYVYGQCDNYWWDKDLLGRKLYIEKFTDDGGNTYIFIAPEEVTNQKEKPITKRYDAMSAKYNQKSPS